MLTMPDGKRLRYARFAAVGRPLKGTVVIVTGRNECIEKYYETIGDLSGRGLGTAIFDMRGQGGSDRLLRDPRRGHIRDFGAYMADLGSFFDQVVLPDCRGPYYLMAHSTGALVALMATPLLANRVERMVLSAPLLGFSSVPFSMRGIRRLSTFLHAIGLGRLYLTGGAPRRDLPPFPGNVLTSDPTRHKRNAEIFLAHPELAVGGATASWIRAACIAIDRVNEPDFVETLQIPTLIVAAGADRVVDTAATEAFARRLRAGSLLTIDGARHELLQEADIYREQFLAAFDAFVPGDAG
jgi:lysophospholipase